MILPVALVCYLESIENSFSYPFVKTASSNILVASLATLFMFYVEVSLCRLPKRISVSVGAGTQDERAIAGGV